MAITNYSELQSAVATWLDRTDLADVMPDFIALGENYINYGGGAGKPLRVREMQKDVALPVENGIAVLPHDFLSLISICKDASEQALFYRIIGEDLHIQDLQNGDINLTYYARVAPLTDASPTNWLLQKHPDIYLRVTQMMAAEFIKDMTQAVLMGQVVDRFIGQLNDAESYDGLRHAGLNLEGTIV